MRKRIGEILRERDYVTEAQINQALQLQSRSKPHKLLGQIFIEQGLISAEQARLYSYCQNCLLVDMIAHINSTIDLQSLLAAIMEAAKVIMEAEASSLIIKDRKTQELIIAVPTGPVSSEISGIRIPPAQGFCGWVATHGEPLIVENAQNDPRFFGDVSRDFKTINLICVPIHDPQGKVIGVLEAINKRDGKGFTKEDIPLFSILADQAAIALEKARLQQEAIEKQLLEQELEMAHQIQRGFWPQQAPRYEGVELAGLNVPAVYVGGDYYDFIPLDDGGCALAIGDVSGKGVPAALLMATLRSSLRAQIENNHAAAETVFLVNNMLVKDTPADKFATLFYGVLDTASFEFTYVNAGHNPPILYDRKRKQMKRLATGGPIIGVLEHHSFEASCEKLQPGQLLLLYTDGVTEALNRKEEIFGEARLQELIRRHAAEDAKTLIDRVHQAVVDFTEGVLRLDDMTLMVMKIEP
jgi:sigma-B regulation protein RsbU (phosphoserine phosphatase)